MINRQQKYLSALVLLLGLPAHAEISGSGMPNSGCFAQLEGLVWHDANADGVADAGEPGVAGISLYLVYDDDDEDSAVTATTDASGRYQFNYLCEGDYIAVVDEATLPEGLSLLLEEAGDDDDDGDLGGWEVEIEDETSHTDPVDIPLRGCPLRVEASCSVASLATELYTCEKPINTLSLTWNGEQTIRVVAHLGNADSPVIAEHENVVQGQTITVQGYDDAPDDVIWEIFDADTGELLGESKFRLACDDDEMNGVEDCGLPQGDGRDNKSYRVNDWQLAGMVDDSGLLDCGQPAASSTCEIQGAWANCDIIDKPRWLTFVYTGGGCEASNNDQRDKFECSGTVAGSDSVTVTTEDGDNYTVGKGEAFTIAKDGSDTDILLSAGTSTNEMRIHTSCSRSLEVGDVFGDLTLVAINGIGLGSFVDYDYKVSNRSDFAQLAQAREAPRRTLANPGISVDAMSDKTVSGTTYVMTDTTSAILATGEEWTGAGCGGADYVPIIVTPPSPCEISGSGLHMHDKEIRWTLVNGGNVAGVVDSVTVTWPDHVTDKLKEIKLDGDKFFDADTYGGHAEIDRGELTADQGHRKIPRNESRLLKVIFDDTIEDVPLEEFELRVDFRQGCSIAWQPGS